MAAIIQAIPIPKNTQKVFAGASFKAIYNSESPEISDRIENSMIAFNIVEAGMLPE
ncbi:hypothetical protein D3C87_2127480 [compost metagenome]